MPTDPLEIGFGADIGPAGAPEPEFPSITDDDAGSAAYETFKPGTKFKDPTGQLRTKPYSVTGVADYAEVPEGAEFLDPEGTLRKKPEFKGVGFTAQTLYDMALNDVERRRALERSYPGQVEEDFNGELMIREPGGTLRKPGRGVEKVTGGVAAMAAPVGFSGLGAVGGSPGGIAGAAAGGAGGAFLGQGFNDVVLALTGVASPETRTKWEEAGNLAVSGMMGSAGAGVGKGLGIVFPTAKAALQGATSALPGAARYALGVKGEDLSKAVDIAEKGVKVSPSTYAHEAPHLSNIVDVFYKKFHTDDPLGRSVKEHYEKTAREIAEQAGIDVHDLKTLLPDVDDPRLLDPKAAVSSRKAGEAVKARVQTEAMQADAALQAKVDDALTTARGGQAERLGQMQVERASIEQAAADASAKAQELVDIGLNDIEQTADVALKAVNANVNSGDLWEQVGQKFQALRMAVGQRAKTMYDQADRLSQGIMPNSEGLSEQAHTFMQSLPPDFKGKYPDLVKRLERLGGVQNEKGEWIVEPHQPTWSELHEIRSLLRHEVNYYDLAATPAEGAHKYFSKVVDGMLHDIESVPELAPASTMLKEADRFYAGALKPFKERQIQTVVNQLRAGMPPDPAALFKTLVKSDRTDLINQVEKMIGPNLMNAIRSAGVKDIIAASRDLAGDFDASNFARIVNQANRTGMMDTLFGKEFSGKMRELAKYVMMKDGKLPIPVRQDDTIASILTRARDTAREAELAAKRDPLKLLSDEMEQIKIDHKKELRAVKDKRAAEELGFLYNPTVGAAEAADRILENPDLIVAAATKFGENSEEFKLLRQTYLHRVLQGSMNVAGKLEKIPAEVQQLLFPGATLKQLHTLADEIEFLSTARFAGSGAGPSLAAQSQVQNPWGTLGSSKSFLGAALKGTIGSLPGSSFIGRMMLSKFYQTVTNLVTSPATLKWLAQGLEGSPAEQEAARAVLRRIMSQAGQKGAGLGAGIGEAIYQQ